MRIDHVALWTRDRDSLERLRAFYARYFGARAGARYESANRPGFASYFLEFPGEGGPAEGVGHGRCGGGRSRVRARRARARAQAVNSTTLPSGSCTTAS